MTAIPARASDGGIERVYASDAYVSAMSLAVLMIAWGALNLSVGHLPSGFARVVPFAQGALAAAALVYLYRTWQRPRPWVALFFSIVEIASMIVFVPLLGVVLIRLDRHWDAFLWTQIALVSMPLVAPRYLRLGMALVGVFVVESIGLAVYGYGRPSSQLELALALTFGAGGLMHLVLHEQRRRLAVKHVLIEGEERALERLAPMFTSMRGQLGSQLHALSDAMPKLDRTRSNPATARALARLSAVERQIQKLTRDSPAVAPTETVSERERRWSARNAQMGAITFAALVVFVTSMAFRPLVAMDVKFGLAMLGLGLSGLFALVYLMWTRARPSETNARAISLVLLLITLVAVTSNHLELNSWGPVALPFQPFAGHKLLMMSVPLVAPRRPWVAIGFVLLVLLNALIFYWLVDVPLPLLEPGATLLVAAMGIGLILKKEQRRVTSAQLLRAEVETSLLRRRATVLLALRDKLNSPLQSLVLHVATFKLTEQPKRDRGESKLPQVETALDHLIALSNELATLQGELPPETLPTSFDATLGLRSTT